jgi:uncharacterized protein YbjT (DUF2867 family)
MTAARRRVLVVGGTSGTGALVVRRLATARTHDVRVLARRPDDARRHLPAAVEVVGGDLLDWQSLSEAVAGVDTIVHTAGVRGVLRAGRHRAVVVGGTARLLGAARGARSAGSIVFVSSMGVTRASALGWALDLVKGDALTNKRIAEHLIRASGLDHLILRAGVLTNGPSGRDRVVLSPEPQPLRLGLKVARADVAAVIAEVLDCPALGGVTTDVYGRRTSLR